MCELGLTDLLALPDRLQGLAVAKKIAKALIKPGTEPNQGILNMVEMGFRSFDPCFSCATHSLPGQMPLAIKIYKGGQVYREFKQYC